METLDTHSWAKIEAGLQLQGARFFTEYEGDFNMLHATVADAIRT